MKRLLVRLARMSEDVGEDPSPFTEILHVVERGLTGAIVKLGVTQRILIVPQRLNQVDNFLGFSRHFFMSNMAGYPVVEVEKLGSLVAETIIDYLTTGFVLSGVFTYDYFYSTDINDRPVLEMEYSDDYQLSVKLVSVPLILNGRVEVRQLVRGTKE